MIFQETSDGSGDVLEVSQYLPRNPFEYQIDDTQGHFTRILDLCGQVSQLCQEMKKHIPELKSAKRKDKETADKALTAIDRDQVATLIVAGDLKSQNSDFPIVCFNDQDGLVFDWLLEGGPKHLRYLSLKKIMSKIKQDSLFEKLGPILMSLAKEFSNWLDVDFINVRKSANSSCGCCRRTDSLERVHRSIFKDCEFSGMCKIHFYCLNSLNHVYVSRDSPNLCKSCHESLLKKVSKRDQGLHPSLY